MRTTSNISIEEATVSFADTFGPLNFLSSKELSLTGTSVTSAELIADTTGAVSISDVIMQLRHIVGLDELTGFSHTAADNDGDGAVAISDVINSLRMIVGLEEAPNALLVNGSGARQFSFDATSSDLYVLAPGDADLSWILTDIT